jgi:hypothetical protein
MLAKPSCPLPAATANVRVELVAERDSPGRRETFVAIVLRQITKKIFQPFDDKDFKFLVTQLADVEFWGDVSR